MMKYAVLVACVALSLQVEAHPYRHLDRRSVEDNKADHVFREVIRHSVEDNEVDLPQFKVNAPWQGNPDEGYPRFDGNPFKQSLVEMSAFLASIAADALEDEKEVPPVIKSIIKGAQRTDWESFDEYLNYWGTAQVALMKEIENEQPSKIASSEDDEDDEDDSE